MPYPSRSSEDRHCPSEASPDVRRTFQIGSPGFHSNGQSFHITRECLLSIFNPNITPTYAMADLTDEPRQLLALLDQLLHDRGVTNTSYAPNLQSVLTDVAASAFSNPSKDLPPSLTIYPRIGLATHLDQHDRDLEARQSLEARIAALCLCPATLQTAKSIIIAEARDHGSPLPDNLTLPAMLVTLRTEQQLASEVREATFTITAVPAIHTTGRPDDLITYHLPTATDWTALQRTLRDITTGYQAKQAGFPDGYTLKEGKWLYQITTNRIPDKTLHELGSDTDYNTLRKTLTSASIGVLIWHRRLWDASQAARALWEECLQEEREASDDDPTELRGWEVAVPGLDPEVRFPDGGVDLYDGGKVVLGWAPSAGPLSG